MVPVPLRPRKAVAAGAVLLLHAAIVAILFRGLNYARYAERDFAPLSLKFFPEPAPTIPYLSERFTAPLTTPRLNTYAPLPELVIPFVPSAAGNVITPPQASAETPLNLRGVLACNLANFENLSPEEKLRCGAVLGRTVHGGAALRVPTAQEATLEATWAAFVRKPPPLAAMPAHEIYGDWWQGMFWPMPNNSLDQKLMK